MRFEAPRGTADVLPAAQPLRERIVATAEGWARRAGYGRITLPTFEDTSLFARSAGAGSDVVQKEMYTFTDRADRSLTLRPEGTAQVVRAYLEHGQQRAPQPFKAFYTCPMFRYAAPQKGRLREFWQVGLEAIGSADAALDAEVVALVDAILRELGIDRIRLELNSIGCRACRPAYLDELRAFLVANDAGLDEDARRKAETSPLRVFDSKSADVQALLRGAPTIAERLCEACREHFATVRGDLDALGVAYVLAPTLVRGLDYYTRTVFEVVDEGLDAAQSTICAGGRYDQLVEELGGPSTPGIGWAAGIERLTLSLLARGAGEAPPAGIDVFLAVEEPARRAELVPLLHRLRASRAADTDYAGRSLKGQLTQAGRLGARLTVVARGDGFVVREHGVQDEVFTTVADLEAALERRLA
ncbi:MAG: histidine--tRNA ligase [Thermoleophilia bacterium]